MIVYYTYAGQRYPVHWPETEEELHRLIQVAWRAANQYPRGQRLKKAIYTLLREHRDASGFVVVGQAVYEIREDGHPYGLVSYDYYCRLKR